MGVRIFSNLDGAVFYCSTTDWAFGPIMPGENVAEAFLKTLTRDARLYEDAELESAWNQFNATLLTCPAGHHEADVTNYSNGLTEFACMEEGCHAAWDLEGNAIKEEDEDEARVPCN